jgi:hypothetical protein
MAKYPASLTIAQRRQKKHGALCSFSGNNEPQSSGVPKRLASLKAHLASGVSSEVLIRCLNGVGHESRIAQ